MKEQSNERGINPVNLIIGIALVAAVLIAVSVLLFNNEKKEEKVDYVKQIQDYRQEKDMSFKNSEESPIENKREFDGLSYFYPNPDYIVEARLERITDSLPLTIMRSDGRKETYLKYARAIFELNKREHKVVLLKNLNNENQNNLFLPFSDLTAGRETYPGGRYLDLEVPEENKVTIDFNMSYNPYCVYNYRYSCPLPPKENFIDTEIEAGEKMYRD